MSEVKKTRDNAIPPYPVTRAYLEKSDFYARIDEEWQRSELRRQLLEEANRALDRLPTDQSEGVK